MILTEKEARKKECKHNGILVGIHRLIVATIREACPKEQMEEVLNALNSESFCSASACAHWRWWDEPMIEDDKGIGLIASPYRRGYCGLSGKPEEGKP